MQPRHSHQPGLLRVADIVIFLAGVTLVAISYMHFWQSSPADIAIVRNHQQESFQLPLHTSQVLSYEGALGTSIIEVNQGRIRFRKSPCQNKLCIHSGWHRDSGDIAACLPNRISIQLASRSGDNEYDAINF